MTGSRPITRRRLIGTAIAVGIPVAVAPLEPWRALVRLRSSPLATRLPGLLERHQSAVAIGREYLRCAEAERTTRALVEGITAGLPGGRRASDAASASELRRLVFSRVQQDFDRDITVELRGWIVSRTEARLCALAAVEDGAGRPV